MSAGQNAGDSAANIIKEGWAKFHGAGEAIRGNVNTFADDVTNTNDVRSKDVAQKGEAEFKSGVPQHQTGQGAGVTPADTDKTHTGISGRANP